MNKKNTASLVLAIIGSIFGIIGAVLWSACADTCANIVGSSSWYTAGFIVLGLGGAIVSLIGGIQAFGFKRGRFALSVIGLIMQVGNLILQCVFAEGFSFILSCCTILSIILLLIATILAKRNA